MITGLIHQGSGLGNQLHRYVMTRVLALDKGYDYSFDGVGNFKGFSFMNLDWGSPLDKFSKTFMEERINTPQGVDIRPYDPRINDVEDETVIDGEFQDEKYFDHRKNFVREWLKVEPINLSEDLCVINFRGGEYKYFPDLFLTRNYWKDAIMNMRKINPNMTFRVVTDDVDEARAFFGMEFEVRHDIGSDWRHIRYAPYLILSNSSFAILPALLNQNLQAVIAPKFWARHNVSDGYWALEQNIYRGWHYQDREGNLEICKK